MRTFQALLAAVCCLSATFGAEARLASVRVTADGNMTLPAVIGLDKGEVRIEFDDIDGEPRDLRYGVWHRGADWGDEGLVDAEWMDSFNERSVEDFSFSRGTLSHYIHYFFEFSAADLRLKIPGNYEVRVWEATSPDEILLTERFRVEEKSARVRVDVSPRTDVDYLGRHQQLEIEIEGRPVADALAAGAVTTTVERERVQGEKRGVRLTMPGTLRGNKLIYSHIPELIFDGGNEWRRFETVSTEWPGIGVESVGYDPAEGYYAVLRRDGLRSGTGYVYDQTQGGGFTVRNYNSDRSDEESEYVTVFFTLECDERPGKLMTVEGEFTGGTPLVMEYNPAEGVYRARARLKQGAYDYRYVEVHRGGERDLSLTEGNYCDTGNPYYVYVYYRLPGERFDRLAGWARGAVSARRIMER